MKISHRRIVTIKSKLRLQTFHDDLRSNLLEMMIFVMPAEIFRKMKLPKRYTRNSNRCEHFPVVLFLTVVKMSTHGIFYTVYDQCIFTKFF